MTILAQFLRTVALLNLWLIFLKLYSVVNVGAVCYIISMPDCFVDM